MHLNVVMSSVTEQGPQPVNVFICFYCNLTLKMICLAKFNVWEEVQNLR